MIKTLCLGGSFNPIHWGHLRCSRAVAQRLGYKRVLLIPSARPPHKPGDRFLASPEHRLAMCRLAAEAASDPQVRFEVDDLEIRRPGPNYTIDTVRQLKARAWPSIDWLIGADMLLNLPNWKDPQALLAEVNFLVMARPGVQIDWKTLPPALQKLQQHVVPIPEVNVSGTEIRRRVRAGEPIDDLTPPSVARYIAEHRLYE
jgi:nicotinate-nucleotide adenylyltransferase